MKTVMKTLLATTALVAATGLASAADMPARMATKAPVMAPMFNWSGVYIGIHGGYAWIDSSGAGGGGDIDGGFGGGQIGINWQAPGSNWVFGLEADGAFADINNNGGGGFNAEIDSFGSIRGRIGYAWGPTMLYATGGYGWANLDVSGAFGSGDRTLDGFVVGGGIEHAINAGPWSVKVEYLYYGFSDETFGAGAATVTTNDLDMHTIKVGLNYRFMSGLGRW